MTEEQETLVGVEIRSRFYYVGYPDTVPSIFWKDRGGELHYISDMGLDHLKNAILLVKKDLKYLKDAHRPAAVVAAIKPEAEKTLAALQEEFERQSNF